MPPLQPQAEPNLPLSMLPFLPTRAPPAKAISRDTTMPAAWNPPWTLGVRVWYAPVKSKALMNLPRAEMVRIAPGRILPGSGGATLPCSLEDSSLSPSLFCNGRGECHNDRRHLSLPSSLAPGKVLPRRSPKYKHFFCFLQPYLTPETMQGWREEHFPTHRAPEQCQGAGYGSLFETTRSQLKEMSLLHFSKANTASAPHVFEGERGNSEQLTRAVNCSSLPAQGAPGKIYSHVRVSSCLTLPFHIHPLWLQLQ